MATRSSCQIYFVSHTDGRLTGILLRRFDRFFDKPAPSAYGESEEEVQHQLELQLAELCAEGEDVARYLWDESFEIRRADVTVFPQTVVKKLPVVGKKRVPLKLSYVACRLKSGAWRVMLPRFGWWMMVEDLQVAAETLRNAVSAALLGEHPRWIYDFRREGREYVRRWTPDLLRGGAAASDDSDDDDEEDYPVLNAVAEELVERAARRKLPPVIGDSPEADRCLELVLRYPPPSLLLVGPPGVGKSTLVRRLARQLARKRRELGRDGVPRIWRTSGDRIIAGMVYLGMWQQRCFDMLEELRYEGDYLYVDRLSSVMARQSDGAAIIDLLAPALLAGEISLLAECSPAELEHHRRRNPALINALEIVRIPETPRSEMPALLAQYLERQAPQIAIHPEGLGRLVQYLDLFVRATCFPGKGFHFVDWLAQQEEHRGTLYPGDVARAFSSHSGLPVEVISDDHPLHPDRIAARLGERVIGQPEACQVSARVIARLKARLNDPLRPVGTLLFVGPTGVGKTELAKQLTRYLFGDENRIIRLDMSEYMTAASAQQLLEVGPGVRSLAQRVREQPLSVVLLDEIEKAHPHLFDLLLGVLGEGRLTDALGRLVDFRMTLIVMTSNIGVSRVPPAGFGERQQEDFLRQVRSHFRPEFFNRLDHVVVFRNLAREDILRIVDLVLAEANARGGLRRRGVRLHLSQGAREQLARAGFHPTRGARPLKRVIEEQVVTPAAVRLAAAPDLAGRTLAVVVEGEPAWERLSTDERRFAIVLQPAP